MKEENSTSKMTKESFYFTHDYGARNDPKILELRAEYGLEGLGLYWCIVETLAEADDGYINPNLLAGLSIGYGVTKAKLQEQIDFMIKVELLREDENGYYSKRMMEHKQIRKKLSEAGKKGAKRRWGNREAKGGLKGGHGTPNAKESKVKERKVKENKGKNTNTNTKRAFDFKKSMLAYGFDKELVDEWMVIRKKKNSVNSEFAFNCFISQVEKAGAEKNKLLKIIAEKQWAGFNHGWMKNLNKTLNGIENETDRRVSESEKRKQEIYEFAKSVGMVDGEEKPNPE